MPRSLTREEGKLITRRRLLEAAAKLLGETGYGALSASAVARAAGVAQPTFYVHFRDKDDLLETLADERIGELRARLREARERVRAGEGVDAVRDTFRLPLETLLAQPALFRLYAQEHQQPGSPLGEKSRRLRDEVRRDLAEDLVRLGLPAATPHERQQVQMIAESMIAQTEALGLGYLDGRYDDLESIVEVLTRFAVGVLGLR
ncbi:MAG: TetR/AcrR family transcriptional regulator [Candidatus Binatia bacterium]